MCVNSAGFALHMSHHYLCIGRARGRSSPPACARLMSITADESCGAAGRQWDMSVHLLLSLLPSRPAAVCHSVAAADSQPLACYCEVDRRLHISCQLQGEGFHLLDVVLRFTFRCAFSVFGAQRWWDATLHVVNNAFLTSFKAICMKLQELVFLIVYLTQKRQTRIYCQAILS